jgi:hypothetical protein
MTIPTTTKNEALDGILIDQMSAHTDYPGTTGTNEVTGGTPAYARQSCTINASSGGARLLNAAVVFDVPACTVKWLGLWGSSVFRIAIPNGGATPKNFMAIPSSDLIYSTGHGWLDNQKIVFFGTPPGGLTEGTTYFVINSFADTFQVAATLGGPSIDLTSASSAGCWVIAISEQNYASQNTHTVSAGTITIPD